MMDQSILAELVGFAAGSVLLWSGSPALWEHLNHPHSGTPGERQSRLWMAAGNLLWVASGILSGTLSIIFMCGLNSLIQLEIWRRMNSAAK